MNKFYVIIDPEKNLPTKNLLGAACKKRKIEYIEIDMRTNKIDYVKCPKPSAGDCLYRVVANDLNAKKLEYMLIKEGVATFYSSSPDIIFRPHAGIKLEKFNLPAPKTIPIITSDRDTLKNYADHLGGFPLIIKAMGGKEGVGVMRVDSLGSFYSIADYLYKQKEDFILRQYIETRMSLRLVVLGNKIIACMKYKASYDNDFRSNRKTKLDNVEIFTPDEKISLLAISSVKCMDLEFGGVDIILDSSNNPYVLEVNFPCNFVEAQDFTQVDIAGLLVEYLVNKATSLKNG
jgi:hypothetical protein